MHILGRMNAKTIPFYGMVMPTAKVAGTFPSPVKLDALVWAPSADTDGEVPKSPEQWKCHPVDVRLIPLQRLAGVKDGDTEEEFKITLHFTLCPELSGLALKTATCGGSQRDARYGKFMGEPLGEGDLVRLGLRAPRAVPPLQQTGGTASGTASPVADGGEALPEGKGDDKADVAKTANKQEGDASA